MARVTRWCAMTGWGSGCPIATSATRISRSTLTLRWWVRCSTNWHCRRWRWLAAHQAVPRQSLSPLASLDAWIGCCSITASADGSAIASPRCAMRSSERCVRIGAWGRGCSPTSSQAIPSACWNKINWRATTTAASPETAAMLLELVYGNDVRSELGQVLAPTLVVHRRGEPRGPLYQLGHELAAGMQRATLIPLDGSAHFHGPGIRPRSRVRLRSGYRAPNLQRAWPQSLRRCCSPAENVRCWLDRERVERPEIAEQLVLSEHTVHRHVANIRHKLGRGTRTAAVAEAARLGLL